MDLISYRGIPMRVIQSLPHVRTVELDESRASYKWTRYDYSFIVTLEPSTVQVLVSFPGTGLMPPNTSATPPPVNVPPGIAGQQTMPGFVDGAIRRFLEYPRGTLIIRTLNGLNIAGGAPTISLTSPAPGMPCDANNGPFCKVNSIQEIAGEALWQVHLTFTTYIYEDSLAAAQTPPTLISNRWAVTTDTNELHLTDRIVEGIVHFRANQLITGPGSTAADFFRSVFAGFSVPSGFERKKVVCTTAPQGNMVRYRIVDREQPYQQSGGPQVRLEYVERSWMWRGSAGRFFGRVASRMGFDVFDFVTPVVLARAPGRVSTVLDELGRNFPKRYKTVIARAWGNRLINRAFIVQRALQLAQARIGVASVILPYTNEISISYHSAQLMAQVEQTINWSYNEAIPSVTQVLNLGQLIFGGSSGGLGDDGFSEFAGTTGDAVSPDLVGPMLQLAPNRIQPPFPNASGTHGSWPTLDSSYLNSLATQTLENIDRPLGNVPKNPP